MGIDSPWEENVSRIESGLIRGLDPCRSLPAVADVRVLGAIGVVETREAVNLAEIQSKFVQRGVWIRPFGKLIYIMPPFIMGDDDLSRLTSSIADVINTA